MSPDERILHMIFVDYWYCWCYWFLFLQIHHFTIRAKFRIRHDTHSLPRRLLRRCQVYSPPNAWKSMCGGSKQTADGEQRVGCFSARWKPFQRKTGFPAVMHGIPGGRTCITFFERLPKRRVEAVFKSGACTYPEVWTDWAETSKLTTVTCGKYNLAICVSTKVLKKISKLRAIMCPKHKGCRWSIVS